MVLITWVAFWFTVLLSLSKATTEVIQLYHPIAATNGSPGCAHEVLLMVHTFASSYGKPFVGSYKPPRCDFNAVHMNLTVHSKGRQFDRLALMFLGDNEVFRTSTAEPTTDGIVWTYIKDMSPYNALWKNEQKLIFDLGNLINDNYTAPFHVRLTALFSRKAIARTADMILPISALRSATGSSSAFRIPGDNAQVKHIIPPTVSRAIVSISACGQSTEEFWWSNVFSSDTGTFNRTGVELYGFSPFREIQLYIDGILAGVVWPFPIIFTGGVAPGFWRPVVGIDAFDLREPEINITPFLRQLTDNMPHSFEIRVVGIEMTQDGKVISSGSVGPYWVVTGNIFLYIDSAVADSSRARLDPDMPQVAAPPPQFKITRELGQNRAGANETLKYSVEAKRLITISSSTFRWRQILSYSNLGILTQQGLSQFNGQKTAGRSLFQEIGENGTLDEVSFKYPLIVNATSGKLDGKLTVDASMQRGLDIEVTGAPGISTYTLNSGPSQLHTEQWGDAYYQATGGGSISFGDMTCVFESNNTKGFYERSVRAVNGSIVSDTGP